jgi:hypothetical protein
LSYDLGKRGVEALNFSLKSRSYPVWHRPNLQTPGKRYTFATKPGKRVSPQL